MSCDLSWSLNNLTWLFGVKDSNLFHKKVMFQWRFEPWLILCSNDSFSIFASVFVLSWFNISISITTNTTLSTLNRDPQPALKRHLVVKSWWLHSHSLTDLITEATAIETLISIVYIDNRTLFRVSICLWLNKLWVISCESSENLCGNPNYMG